MAPAFLLLALLPVSSQAVVISDYNSSAHASGYTLTAAPTNLGDAGTLPTLAAGQYYSVTSIVVARLNGAAGISFDVGFFLWNTVDTTSTTSIFSNLASSTSITYAAGALNLQSGQTFGYQMEFAVPGTINLSTAAYTPTTGGTSGYLINQGTSPSSGTSPDTFYVGTNNNGTFNSGNATTQSGTGTAGYNNVFLVINATIVPEPATNVALACGGLILLGSCYLRRRAAANQA